MKYMFCVENETVCNISQNHTVSCSQTLLGHSAKKGHRGHSTIPIFGNHCS